MQLVAGQTVLITGAAGGLGKVLTLAFAECGLNLALVSRPGPRLDDLCRQVSQRGRRVLKMPVDLRDLAQAQGIVPAVLAEFGAIDLLVNNAALEPPVPFHEMTERDLQDALRVNLEAPLVLVRAALPGMLQRGCGHIVNVSSLAGKAGPAFCETYAAAKAGLIGFTQSLRATYQGTGVSASAICPGFIETGMYHRIQEDLGCSAPARLGTVPPEMVACAVLQAVERDRPEMIVNRFPVRPGLALAALWPRLGEWLGERSGMHDFFREAATAMKAKLRPSLPTSRDSR